MGQSERTLKDLGARLAGTQDEQLARIALGAGSERLLAAAARAPRRRRLTRGGVAGALALAAALAIFVGRPRSLSFAVGAGDAGHLDAWIAAPDTPLPVRFSDGTELDLAPEARARVVALDDRGARVVLEKGRLSASVVHRDKTRWVVGAGPFEVLVTGTRFDVAWTPEGEVFHLDLREGSVIVTGPLLGSGRAVAAGETLEVAVGAVRLGSTSAAPPALSAPVMPGEAPEAPEPSPPAAPGVTIGETPRPSASAPAAGAEAARPSFAELATAGRYADAVRAAEAEGFSTVCARASAGDLMKLADAARFSGQGARATEALGALRQRFPGDARAATAAFLLGRTAFEQRGAYAEAAHWFSAYLAEQPGGTLAREAMARLMECHERGGDREAARAAARRYLDAYPAGPQAAKAKSLLED
jgi:transmembrane sensor